MISILGAHSEAAISRLLWHQAPPCCLLSYWSASATRYRKTKTRKRKKNRKRAKQSSSTAPSYKMGLTRHREEEMHKRNVPQSNPRLNLDQRRRRRLTRIPIFANNTTSYAIFSSRHHANLINRSCLREVANKTTTSMKMDAVGKERNVRRSRSISWNYLIAAVYSRTRYDW